MPKYCHFFLQSSRCVSKSSHVLKQLDYMMIIYFYLICFTFSISYSVLPFHLVYVFQYLHLLFFFMLFLKLLSSIVEKLSYQIRSVAQSCPTLCDPMNRSTPGLPVHHQLPEFTQTHIHRVSDAIQPSHPLSSPSPLAPNPSQHQSLFQ